MIRPARKKAKPLAQYPKMCFMSVTSIAIFGKSAGVNPPLDTGREPLVYRETPRIESERPRGAFAEGLYDKSAGATRNASS